MLDNIVFEGNLTFLSLADILQLLGTNGSHGVLRISSKYAQEPGLVYILGGNPIHAECMNFSGVDALYQLFGWMDGTYEFSNEEVQQDNTIHVGRMEIILNGLRKLDDGEIEILGPVSNKDKGSRKDESGLALPIIRGPIVDYMSVVDEELFYDGDTIVREGKHGGWVWVILEGVVRVVKKNKRGDLTIMKIGDGSFIGTTASLTMSNPARSATIVAEGAVRLGVLDSQRLSAEYGRLSNEMRGIMVSLDKRLRRISRTAIYESQGDKRTSQIKMYRKKIIKQGKEKEGIYVIKEGEALIVRSTSVGHIPLGKLYPGDFLGNIPFLDIGQEPYSASILGTKNLKVVKIDLDAICAEFDRISSTLRSMVENTATSIAATSMIACDLRKIGKEKPPKKA